MLGSNCDHWLTVWIVLYVVGCSARWCAHGMSYVVSLYLETNTRCRDGVIVMRVPSLYPLIFILKLFCTCSCFFFFSFS